MNNEWKELKCITDVAEAVAAGMYIEVFSEGSRRWESWKRLTWYSRLKYRAKPFQLIAAIEGVMK